ncbi:RNA-binding protein 12-like [Amyelois transitella]|uniref:RNA-binding protein 12-like n=1 Tax=Amyelois transitella TaxID=680683 RepID=UPI00298FB3CF|nr:RNA-binding protein 12-like [Amyelois transitella]
MAVNTLSLLKVVKVLIILTAAVNSSQGINLGLIAGDLKLPTKPLSITKYSRHSPIFVNINSRHNLLPDLPPLPKLPSKPPPLPSLPNLPRLPLSYGSKISKLLSSSKLPKLGTPLWPLMPPVPFLPPIIPPLFPLIPKLPLLPILPPIIPPLTLLPPILPRIPMLPLSSPFGPLKVPILGKSPLQKALSSELKPLILPSPSCKRKGNIMDKLADLRKKGSLTTGEYLRFKKLLL